MLNVVEVRDVARALPPLVSEHRVFSSEAGELVAKSAETSHVVLADKIESCRQLTEILFNHTMAAFQINFDELGPDEFRDPENEAIDSLEEAQQQLTKFHKRISSLYDNLDYSRVPALLRAGINRDLDIVNELFPKIIACMQELRWALLIREGSLAKSTGESFECVEDFLRDLDEE